MAQSRMHTPNLAMYPAGTELVPLGHVRLSQSAARKNLAVKDLKDQIQTQGGILEPLTVSISGQTKDGEAVYEVIHGSRRWMAAMQLGHHTLPVCIIKPMSDIEKLRVQLINNCSRRELSIIDEAQAILEVLCGRLKRPQHEVTPLLHKLGHTERESGNKVIPTDKAIIDEVLHEAGRTLADYRSNLLKVLSLPEDTKQAFNAGAIKRAHMELLGRVKSDDQRKHFLAQTINQKLTKGQLLVMMEQSRNPELQPTNKDLADLHQHFEHDLDVLRNSPLWRNLRFFADFQKEINRWTVYATTELAGLESA
ncbi:MAG: ParB N-terminal domain-containing protein [Cyanobacteria bacterium P01_D01_bin.56]